MGVDDGVDVRAEDGGWMMGWRIRVDVGGDDGVDVRVDDGSG